MRKNPNKEKRFNQNKLASSAMTKHRDERAYKRDDNMDFWITMLIVIVAVFSFRLFVFEPIRVDGTSMEPTLHDTERMFVEKLSYWFNPPQRGDIVICHYPNKGDRTYVKRVVGLPGEKLEIKTDGRVYINDEVLDESDYWTGKLATYPAIVIPDDCVFVMGDNRYDSMDSRDYRVGPIPICRVIGRVRGIIWPFDQVRDF